MALATLWACLALAAPAAAQYAPVVTVSGDPVVGSTLTASASSSTTGDPRWQWYRCDPCTPIEGATASTYVVSEADVGLRLVAGFIDGPFADPVFSAATEVVQPAPEEPLERISPFPVVRVAGRFRHGATEFTLVRVRAPRGARIRVTCRGRGCPRKRSVAVTARSISFKTMARVLRPGARLEFRITQENRIGKYVRIRVRDGKAPVRLDRCLLPDDPDPVRCPAS